LNQLPTELALLPELSYPFGKRWSPEPGDPYEVADGVFWLRMPLPIALDHINLWILRDGDGWTLVDTGYDAQICKDVWDRVFESFIDPIQVKRIIVTHFHPDHIGLASWLALRCECPILISQGEFDHYHSIITRDREQFAIEIDKFIRELGYQADMVDQFTGFFSVDQKPEDARVQESMCEIIADLDEIEIDGRSWQVVSGNGHSPEHSCLYCEELTLMISGDQSIPRISSNVSVYPSNRHEDPLGDWLDSCKKLKLTIPDDTMILPSHQEPFHGNHTRMQQLIDEHHSQLNLLRLAIRAPITALQARHILFARELNTVEKLLATGETLAHLNYLVHRGEVSMHIDDQGVAQYSA